MCDPSIVNNQSTACLEWDGTQWKYKDGSIYEPLCNGNLTDEFSGSNPGTVGLTISNSSSASIHVTVTSDTTGATVSPTGRQPISSGSHVTWTATVSGVGDDHAKFIVHHDPTFKVEWDGGGGGVEP